MEFLEKYKINIPKFITFYDRKITLPEADKKIKKAFGYPCVIKPNESGSSVGVSIARNPKQLAEAIKKAFKEDKSVVAQKYIKGRELSCGVMGNSNQDKLVALPVVEIVMPEAEFFDYQTKYFSKTVEDICPAKVNPKISQAVQNISQKVHQILGCAGLTRSDFILTERGELYFLEINTIPGQTEASLCPKEASAAGMPFGKFLEKQIEMALKKGLNCGKLSI